MKPSPAASPCSQEGSSRRDKLLAIVLIALAVRWAYDITLFASMGKEGLMEADSFRYLAVAEQFAQDIAAGSIHGWVWLGPDLGMMPLFTWIVTLHALAAGAWTPLAYVMTQGLMDCGTCLLIFGIADMIDRRAALPAALCASLNPTQIVLSGFVYTDAPFLFFVALMLFASFRWLQEPSWRWAVVIGLAIGAAASCRILIVPWIFILAILLLLATAARGTLQWRHAAQMAAACLVFGLCITPVIARNKLQYDAWALTPQSGVHLAFWVVPLVQEAQDGTPWSRGIEVLKRRFDERYGDTGAANPFESARQHTEFGSAELKRLGLGAMAKAWSTGAAINLAAPAIILIPAVSRLPRTGFFDTEGQQPLSKIYNFLFRSSNATYAWLLLLGIVGVGVIRLVQLVGFAALLRGPNVAGLLILSCWCVFILGVNGPIASPKYRLPIEVPLMVLSGAGLTALRAFIRKLRQ